FITFSFFKLFQKAICPIGAIYFVAIIKKSTKLYPLSVKCFLKMIQVALYGLFTQMVKRKAFTSGCRTLYFLAGPAREKGDYADAFRRCPASRLIMHIAVQTDLLSIGFIGTKSL